MANGQAHDGFYKDILDNMFEGCQIIGFDWRYLYLNKAVEAHSRVPNEELLGRSFIEIWPGITETQLYALIDDCLQQRNSHFMENEFQYPDGSTGWFELRISPVPEGAFIMSLDITERKQMASNLRDTEEQLMRSQKLEAIGKLAGGVAHDFNNIIGVILGHTELALDVLPPGAEVRTDLEEIRNAARRSAELTQQLLAFARKQPNKPQVLDINAVIEDMLRMLRRLIGEDIALRWLPGTDLNHVRMDPSQVEQVLANLCVNARDAISTRGAITLETSNVSIDQEYCDVHPGFLPGDFVMLSVSDNGVGMDKKTSERVFEPFFTTKEMGHGTGLGLSTVYGVVKQNKGFINVYSEPGSGTTFRIYFPRDKTALASVPVDKPNDFLSRGSETILVVEDERQILRLTKKILETFGYHVLIAGTPLEAIEIASNYTSPIHLLFTDVIMPSMTGPDLARRIAAISPETRTLFTSGYTADVIAQRGELDPEVQFLQKPYSKHDLGLKVRAALDGIQA